MGSSGENLRSTWVTLLVTSYGLRKYAVLAIFAYLSYKVVQLVRFTYSVRQRYDDIPHLPRHWFWGNLENIGQRLAPSLNRHPDYGFEEVWNQMGQPSCMLADLAPVDRCMLVIVEPSIAEAVVQASPEYKYSIPKSDTFKNLYRLIGYDSIILQEGEEWRTLRRRFNKGFAPSHLHTLSPLIISKTRVFIERLQKAAHDRNTILLKEYSQDLTTDIITLLTFEKDFQSQSIPEGVGPKSATGFLTASRKLSQLTAKTGQGFDPFGLIDPIRPTKSWYYEKVFNRSIYSVLQEKLDAQRCETVDSPISGKAIVQLALAGLNPDAALLQNTVSQIKSFIFAGQDTTATLIQWVVYELSKANHSSKAQSIVEKLSAEHDAVFGPGAYSALDVLEQPGAADEYLGSKIPYTTAFIKETLRLHPPAGTARLIPEASNVAPPVTIDIDGKPTRIDGLRIYPCQYLIHRNPKSWGPDANSFNPDRWLDDAYMATVPAGAWRPFERGPRNCIGQELALMEAKVVVCTVTRGLKFEKIGMSGGNGEKELHSIHHVTSLPADGMAIKVHLRE